MPSKLRDKLSAAQDDVIVPDYSEARDSLPDFEDLPIGTYSATVIECETGTSNAGGPKVVFKFEVAEDEQVEGCWPTVFRHAPTSGPGSGIFRDTVEALGFDPEEPFKCSSAIDRECVVVIGKRKNGEGTEVKRVKAVPGAKAKPAAKTTRSRTAAKPAAGRRRVG